MHSDSVDIAFVVPTSGSAGIFGPSCIAAGALGAAELNATHGLAGRKVNLIEIDGGRPPAEVANEVSALVATGMVQAVTGWHISAVRQAIEAQVGGVVPYVYPAMHEGATRTPGVFFLGERPSNQINPALTWLSREFGARRWAVVGNDYIWPRQTASIAVGHLRARGMDVVSTSFVPLGTSYFGDVLQRLERDQVDAVMLSLVGQDLVHFNRQFSARGMTDQALRFSAIVEENLLLATAGADNRGLFGAAAFFDSLKTAESKDFSSRYYAKHGTASPPLNAIGESCFEAIAMLGKLAQRADGLAMDKVLAASEGCEFDGARGHLTVRGNIVDQPVYIASAQGYDFVIEDLLTVP